MHFNLPPTSMLKRKRMLYDEKIEEMTVRIKELAIKVKRQNRAFEVRSNNIEWEKV